jgi:hypothetical protein
LVELVYDEADNAAAADLLAHLAGCPACSAQLAALRQSTAALDSAAALDECEADGALDDRAPLNAGQVYRASAGRATRIKRNWRRTALAAVALALTLLVVVGVQAAALRVEVHSSHLVIGWGAPAPQEKPQAAPAYSGASDSGTQDSGALDSGEAPTASAADLRVALHRIEDLETLVRLIASQQATDEREYRLLARELGRRVDRLDTASDQRLRIVGRGMHSLYLNQTAGELVAGDTGESP